MSDTLFLRMIEDHEEIRMLIDDINDEAGKDMSERNAAFCLEAFATLKLLLTAHSRAEEDTLYTVFEDMRSARAYELRKLAVEGTQEHALVDQLLLILSRSTRVDEVWQAQFKVLSDILLHHLAAEEETFFPEARGMLPARELNLLADTYLERHQWWYEKERQQSQNFRPLATRPHSSRHQ